MEYPCSMTPARCRREEPHLAAAVRDDDVTQGGGLGTGALHAASGHRPRRKPQRKPQRQDHGPAAGNTQ